MRITREQLFMDIAEVVAKRSTCLRNNVGSVLVDDTINNIVSIGYNGVPTGCKHCTTGSCLGKGCNIVIHSEMNAIKRSIIEYDHEYSLYVTVSPCINCAHYIASRYEIKKIFYRYPYRDNSGILFLLQKGLQVYRIIPSGEIIEETKEWKGK